MPNIDVKAVVQGRGYDVDRLPDGSWAVLTPLGDRIDTTPTEEHGWSKAAQHFGVTYEPNLPVVTSEDDWLDMNEGDEALIRGRLRSASLTGIIIAFHGWLELYIEGNGDLIPKDMIGRPVEMPMTVNENGPVATEAHIKAIRRTDI